MINGTGAELIAGVLNDLDFGPSVMLGAGGILTELYRDTAALHPLIKSISYDGRTQALTVI